MIISLLDHDNHTKRRLTSSGCRAEGDQEVKTFGLPEPIESAFGIVFTLKSLEFLGRCTVAVLTIAREGIGVEIQKATTLEEVMVELETRKFRKLFDSALHVLYGPVIERIPQFIVRFLGSSGHGDNGSCDE